MIFPSPWRTLGEQSETDETLDRINKAELDKRQIPYTRAIRLVFSLVNEDAAAHETSSEANPRAGLAGVKGWDVSELEKAYERRIQPLVELLDGPYSFTSEVQTVWFAPLPFETKPYSEPHLAAHLKPGNTSHFEVDNTTSANRVHLIDWNDLQIFVDAGQWGLSTEGGSSEQGPAGETTGVEDLPHLATSHERTLNFVVYVPKPSHRPLRVAGDAHASSISAAIGWLIPQWGGVALYNLGHEEGEEQHLVHTERGMLGSLSASDLDKAFITFERQLRSLLGLREEEHPDTDENALHMTSQARLALRVDALVRRRILEASRESVQTLGSIVRLVDKIKILGVGPSVRDDVYASLHSLDKARTLINKDAASTVFQQGPELTSVTALYPLSVLLHLTYTSERISSRAFFNPSMLGQLYFPDEHKYAVYTPMFGPLAVPLLVAGLRLLKEYRTGASVQAHSRTPKKVK